MEADIGWSVTSTKENDVFYINPLLGNAFCPTGSGGGIDPSCGKGESSKGGILKEIRSVMSTSDAESDDDLLSELQAKFGNHEVFKERLEEAMEAGATTSDFIRTLAEFD